MHLRALEPTEFHIRRPNCQVPIATLALVALSTLLLAPSASAQTRLQARIFKALIRVDGNLKFGLEEAPAVLINDLDSSSTACRNALEAEGNGGSSGQSLWITLSQIIERGDSQPPRQSLVLLLDPTRASLIFELCSRRDGAISLASLRSWRSPS